MSLTVVSRPRKTINSLTAMWVSSQLPIVYEMIRQDYTGGVLTSVSLSVPLADESLFNIGDKIWMYREVAGEVVVNQILTVESITPGITAIIQFEEDHDGAIGGTGYLNFITTRPLYRVNVGVYLEEDDSLIATLDYSSKSNGELHVDVTSVVNSQLDAQTDFTFTDALQLNTVNNKAFYIKYTEIWTGSAESETDDSANYFHAVQGKMRIKESNIPNLFDYATGDEILLLKRSSSTEIEKTSVGYLSFINNEERDVTLRIEKYIGETLSTTVDDTFEDLAVGLYDIQIPAESDDTITSIVVSLVELGSEDQAITNSHEFILSEICNPLKFLWRNSLGGLEEFTATDDQIIESNVLSNEKTHRLKFIAEDIEVDKWLALDELNSESDSYRENILTVSEETYRTKVKVDQQVYMIGDETLGVIVIPNTAERRTRHIKNEIEIEVEYPRL